MSGNRAKLAVIWKNPYSFEIIQKIGNATLLPRFLRLWKIPKTIVLDSGTIHPTHQLLLDYTRKLPYFKVRQGYKIQTQLLNHRDEESYASWAIWVRWWCSNYFSFWSCLGEEAFGEACGDEEVVTEAKIQFNFKSLIKSNRFYWWYWDLWIEKGKCKIWFFRKTSPSIWPLGTIL